MSMEWQFDGFDMLGNIRDERLVMDIFFESLSSRLFSFLLTKQYGASV